MAQARAMAQAVERAIVRWAKNQTFGLEFTHLTAIVASRLKKYLSLQSQPAH